MKEVTTVTDFSVRTGYSADRIRQLIDQGEIPAERTPTGQRLPHVDAIEEMAKRRQKQKNGKKSA